MKQKFIDRKFEPAAQVLLQRAEQTFNEYEAQGYDMTLRQIYYVFIAKDWFPDTWIDEKYNQKHGLAPGTKNTLKNYKNFGSIISDGRLAGLLDWDMLVDRGRNMVKPTHWKSPAEIMLAVSQQFRIDLWADQPCYVEVMVEKQALEGILEPVCGKLDIPFTANKGYSSSSAMYEAGQRLCDELREGKEVHIIYLGDHDPSGIDMTRDIEDRLNQFAEVEEDADFAERVHVHRIALNMPQILKWKPPENPAKLTDSRADKYIRKFGPSSWELDALEPRELDRLVREEVAKHRDDDLFEKAAARQQSMIDELVALAKKSKFK